MYFTQSPQVKPRGSTYVSHPPFLNIAADQWADDSRGPSVVDEDVDLAGLLEEARHGFGVGYIGWNAKHATLGRVSLDADFRLLEGLGISADEDDVSRSCTGKVDGSMLKHVSCLVRIDKRC